MSRDITLRYYFTVLLYDITLRYCFMILLYDIALRYYFTILLYDITLRLADEAIHFHFIFIFKRHNTKYKIVRYIYIGAWGSTVVKAVPRSNPGGVGHRDFSRGYRENHVPWGQLSP